MRPLKFNPSLTFLLSIIVTAGFLTACGTSSKSQDQKKTLQWTKSPSLETVPNRPIEGTVNDKTFKPNSIKFHAPFDDWHLLVAEAKPENILGGVARTGRYFRVTLPSTPVNSKLITIDWGRKSPAFLQLNKPNNDGMVSYNAPYSLRLKIDKWNIKDGEGKASGKLYVSYASSDRFEKSWFGGTFKNAIVKK